MDCLRSPTMKIEGGIASLAAPNPSPQLLTSCPRDPIAHGWCPETRRRARAGSAPRAGDGSRRTRPLFQQLDRALEHTGKIEERVRFQRVLVLCSRDGKNPPHAARHDGVQVAAEAADRIGDGRRDLGRARAMPLPGVVGVAVRGREPGARETFAARLAVLGQEIRAQPVRRAPETRLALARLRRRRGSRSRIADPSTAAAIVRPASRTAGGRLGHRAGTPRDRRGRRRKSCASRSPRAGTPTAAVRSRGPFCEKAAQRMRRHQPPIEQRRQPLRSRRSPSCAKTSATSSSSRAMRAADSQRLVERLARPAAALGVVGELEPGIDVGFERELAQQREAKGVDGRDRDVAEPLLQIAPSRGVEIGQAARFFQPLDDPLPHLGRGFSRKGDRQDVIGFDSCASRLT